MFILKPSAKQWSSSLGISRPSSMEWSSISFCLYQRPSPMEWSLISLFLYRDPLWGNGHRLLVYQDPFRWNGLRFPFVYINDPLRWNGHWSPYVYIETLCEAMVINFRYIKTLFGGMVIDLFMFISRSSSMEWSLIFMCFHIEALYKAMVIDLSYQDPLR